MTVTLDATLNNTGHRVTGFSGHEMLQGGPIFVDPLMLQIHQFKKKIWVSCSESIGHQSF